MNDRNLPHRPPAVVVITPLWRHRTSAWYDVGWPVLTGTATALGLTGARVKLGTLGVAFAFLIVALVSGLLTWAAASDLPVSRLRTLVVIPVQTGLVALACIGLVSVLDVWALLVIALVIATSPLIQKRLRGIRERAAVDRRFAEIARSLEADTESAPPDSTDE